MLGPRGKGAAAPSVDTRRGPESVSGVVSNAVVGGISHWELWVVGASYALMRFDQLCHQLPLRQIPSRCIMIRLLQA